MSAAPIELEHDAVIQQLGLHISPDSTPDYCRFSESPLWPLQRQYYQRQGVNASRRRQHEADNPESNLLAENYAAVLVSYWEDALVSGQLDPDEPVYVMELGCGGGAFTWKLLHSLEEKLGHSALQELHWTLLATDMAAANLDYLREHPGFSRWFAAGRLDTLCLDLETAPSSPRSGNGIDLSSVVNPLALIANRLFGSLTQDLLQIHYGRLFETRLALARHDSSAEPQAAAGLDEFSRMLYRLDNPFEDIELQYEWTPLRSDAWLQGDCRLLLGAYLERLDSCSLLLPGGALNCLRYMLQLSAGRCLVLSLDRGHSDEQELRLQHAPQLRTHGDFSLPLNIHLLQRFAELHGGIGWSSPSHEQNGLLQSVLLFARDTAAFGNTETRIHENLFTFTPQDQLALKASLGKLAPGLEQQSMLALLKSARCDFSFLRELLPALLEEESLSILSPQQRAQWCDALTLCRERYLPSGQDSPELFDLGLLALELNHWSCAREIFEALLLRHPDDAAVAHNLALTHLHTGAGDSARALLEQAERCGAPDEQRSGKALLASVRQLQERENSLAWYNPELAADGELMLRPLSWLDAPALCYQYRDPSISVLTRLPPLETLDQVREWISQENRESGKTLYSVVHRNHGFVGIVSFRYVGALGYFYFWIGTDFQNAGLGQQAARLAYRQAAALGIRTLYTSAYSDNKRSIHALERCGFSSLPLRAREPDDELLFYRYSLEPHPLRQQTEPAADYRDELSTFLESIESPISLLDGTEEPTAAPGA